MKFRFPSGYLSLRAAHDQLTSMYQGAQPIHTPHETGIAVVDADCATASAKELRRGVLDNELELYALLSSATPTRLTNQTLIEAALFPANAVMTFRYIDRHPAAPFNFSWHDLQKLSRDPLCLDEQAFRRWFNRQVGKWARTHKTAGESWKSPGRPSDKRYKAIEAIEELHEQGKLRPEASTQQLYALLKRTHPSLMMSLDTVRRARKQYSAKKTSRKSRPA